MSDIFNLKDTWDDGGTTFEAIKMDVTDTASAADSLLLDLKIGGSSKFKVSKSGDVTPVGDVVMASGKGIDFSADANAGGMTSELLDSYEEGVFTPTIIGNSTAGTGTYSVNVGVYTKVGNLVNVTIGLDWSAHDGSGYFRITGLPFIPNAATLLYPASVNYDNFKVEESAAAADQLLAYALGGSIFADLRGGMTDGSSRQLIDLDTSGILHLAIAYRV